MDRPLCQKHLRSGMRTAGNNRMGRCPNTRRSCYRPGGIRCSIQQVINLLITQGGKLHGLSPFFHLDP